MALTRSLFLILLRLFVLVLFVTIITGCAGFWYVWQNPVDLKAINPRIERAVEQLLPAFDVQIGNSVLSIDAEDRSTLIILENIAFYALDGSVETTLPRVEMRLANRALLRAKARPRSILVNGSALELRRLSNDKASISLFPLSDDQRLAAQIDLPKSDNLSGTQPLTALSSDGSRALLKQAQALRTAIPQLSDLEEIRLRLSSLTLADAVTQTQFAANDLDLALSSKGQGGTIAFNAKAFSAATPLIGVPFGGFTTDLNLTINNNQLAADFQTRLTISDQSVPIQASAKWQPGQDPQVSVAFDPLVPARLTAVHPLLKRVSSINLPISGKVDLLLTTEFKPLQIQFDVAADRGEAAFLPFYPSLQRIERAAAIGSYDPQLSRLKVDQGAFVLPLPNGQYSSLEGKFYFDFQAKNGTAIEQQISLVADQVDAETALDLWPSCRKEKCLRQWFERAELDGGLSQISFQQHINLFKDRLIPTEIHSRKGSLKFHSAQMRAWPHLPLVTSASGEAAFDMTETRIALTEGSKTGSATWGATQVQLAHVPGTPLEIRGTGYAASALRPMLETLAQGQVGLSILETLPTDRMSGHVSGDVQLAVRLPRPGGTIGFDDVSFEAQGIGQDLAWSQMVLETDVHQGQLEFAINKSQLTGRGNAQFGNAPIAIDFNRSFSAETVERNRIDLTAAMDLQQALNYAPFLQGYLPFGQLEIQASYVDDWMGDGAVNANADLANAQFQLPFLALEKPIGERGLIQTAMTLDQGRPAAIQSFTLGTYKNGEAIPHFAVAGSGTVDPSSGAWQSLDFAEVIFEKTQLLGMRVLNRRDAIEISIQDGQFDARAVFEALRRAGPNSGATTGIDGGRPILFSVPKLRNVLLPNGNLLSNVSFQGQRFGTQWRSLSAKATLPYSSIPNQAPAAAEVIFTPLDPGQGYELFVETADAGALLSTLGYWKNMGGGFLRFRGQTAAPLLSAPLIGEVAAENFYINNAPLVTDLLNFASLQGLNDIAEGRGLWMDGMVAEIRFDRGLLDLRGAQVGGPSVAVTVNGQIDLQTQQVALSGALAPFNFIGQAFEQFPLLNALINGTRGEGFLAADFTILGPMSEMTVDVNPLTILAPGIFREMFNELTGNVSEFELEEYQQQGYFSQ